jgi:ABC-type polysaccharide/polyol phosphate transport system ATPase subunit
VARLNFGDTMGAVGDNGAGKHGSLVES